MTARPDGSVALPSRPQPESVRLILARDAAATIEAYAAATDDACAAVGDGQRFGLAYMHARRARTAAVSAIYALRCELPSGEARGSCEEIESLLTIGTVRREWALRVVQMATEAA